ncbi:MAG: cupredoxin family copper-binding protein [Patescibacteria group bacterium]
MKKTLIIAILLAAVVVTIGAACGNSSKSTTNTNTTNTGTSNSNATTGNSVTISNFAFSPATLTVTAGTAVTWVNNDSVTHTVTASAFNSGDLAPGQTYTFTFSTPGTYAYSCSIHPTMTGTIIVQ